MMVLTCWRCGAEVMESAPELDVKNEYGRIETHLLCSCRALTPARKVVQASLIPQDEGVVRGEG